MSRNRMKHRIAVIFHKHELRHRLPRFAIWSLANAWRDDGYEVAFLFGVEKHVPADLAVLHVDLTLVPEEYIEFANRYPAVINGRIRDIRKSTYSQCRVNPGEHYKGPVIVKSERNYAGEPERKLLGSRLSRLSVRIGSRFSLRVRGAGTEPIFKSPADYRIYSSVDMVPKQWFGRNDVLVEKFLPEKDGKFFCLRNYHFLGDRGISVLRRSAVPIINMATAVDRREVETPPEIPELARRMQFDFGKFDYVIHDGRPVLLDANKTPGAGQAAPFFAMCREWAKGIRSYL